MHSLMKWIFVLLFIQITIIYVPVVDHDESVVHLWVNLISNDFWLFKQYIKYPIAHKVMGFSLFYVFIE